MGEIRQDPRRSRDYAIATRARSEPERGGRDSRTVSHLHSAIGNQAVQRLVQRETGASETNRPSDGAGTATELPASLKQELEALTGVDLSEVRVHYDSPEPARIGALAYTRGRDIHLGPGQDRHLPHEAWHVIQQNQGRVRPTIQEPGVAINDDRELEREADVMGEKASRSDTGTVQRRPLTDSSRRAVDAGIVQRQVDIPVPLSGGGGGGKPVATEPEWIPIARGEVGQKEISGPKHNPQVIKYHQTSNVAKRKTITDEIPWCGSFVNWVMEKAGYTGPAKSAWSQAWKSWGKRLKEPVFGSIVVFSWGGGKGHVGFVVGKSGKKLSVLGGNQSNQVKVSTYSTGKVAAYVVPNDYDSSNYSRQLSTVSEDAAVEGSYESTR